MAKLSFEDHVTRLVSIMKVNQRAALDMGKEERAAEYKKMADYTYGKNGRPNIAELFDALYVAKRLGDHVIAKELKELFDIAAVRRDSGYHVTLE